MRALALRSSGTARPGPNTFSRRRRIMALLPAPEAGRCPGSVTYPPASTRSPPRPRRAARRAGVCQTPRPALIGGLLDFRGLGSAGSLGHTANRRGGRSACTTESRRSKGGSLWKVWYPWMLALTRFVAALNVDRADNYPATDPGRGGGTLFPAPESCFPASE